MSYSRFAKKYEIKKYLTKLDSKNKIEKSGIPFLHEHNKMYIESSERHNLIIGATGSGKTQATVLPLLKLAILAGENIIFNDENGEIFKRIESLLTDNNYNKLIINTNELVNHYNPLSLAYEYHKENKIDNVKESLYEIAKYIFTDNDSVDPFWNNSATELFVGLSLYSLEKKDEEITFKSIYELIDKLDTIKPSKDKSSFKHLELILNAPTETKGGIISVFKQKLGLLTYKDINNEITSTTDINLKELINNKYVISVIDKKDSLSNILYPILISQIYTLTSEIKPSKRTNIIIDSIESYANIYNYQKYITSGRSLNIRFTVLTCDLEKLEPNYKELMPNSGNVIYLLSNNLYTLEELSKLCGRKNKNKELVSIEDLQRLQIFETIILCHRMNPIKSKLLPDYKIDWSKIK